AECLRRRLARGRAAPRRGFGRRGFGAGKVRNWRRLCPLRRGLSPRRHTARRLGVGNHARFELRLCCCGRLSFAGGFVRGISIDEFRLDCGFRREALALASATIAPAATAAPPAAAALPLRVPLAASSPAPGTSTVMRLLK